MKWSPQQDGALKAVSAWLKDKNGPQVFRLFGWAGTGKSTLATHLAKDVKKVCYAAFTGKAALVMQRRGCTGASTIHSLIYSLSSERGGEPQFMLNENSSVKHADLVVIDEVSMVDEGLAQDLLSFGTKVLVLGDPFQLPPVKGAGYFINAEPDIMLTEIHRQAADNPIIRLSMDIREGRGLEYGSFGDSKVIRSAEVEQGEVLGAGTIIVGKNKTRKNFNARVRELKDLPLDQPVSGDRVICLRNNREKRLLNGQLWTIAEVTSKGRSVIEMLLEPDDAGKRAASALVTTHMDIFLDRGEEMPWSKRREFDEFTFGYALTCHKSQGSQWDSVYLFNESAAFRDQADRWLYTAVTRAAERITIVQ